MHNYSKSRLYKHRSLIKLKVMCDEYLCREDATPSRVAINTLHFISQHNSHLAKYREFLSDEPRFFSKVKNRVFYFLKLLKLVQFGPGAVLPKRGKLQTDVIIFSHLNNIDNLNKDSDFYFGDLRTHFANSDIEARYVYLNNTGAAKSGLAAEFQYRAPKDILLLNKFGLFTLYGVVRSLLRERQQIIREWASAKKPSKRKFYGHLIGRVLDVQSVRNYAVYLEFVRVVQKYNPKVVICTYEGHAFERLIFHAARSADEATRCIAYQHTLVYEFQHCLIRMIGGNYDPDVILTSGELSRMAIQKKLNSTRSVEVRTAGTIRALVMNKKFCYSSERSACLVAPDGTIGECQRLFGYAVAAALLNRDIEFVFRLHPIVSFALLRKRGVLPPNLPQNVTLSSVTLECDLSRCSWVLYRSSSVAVAGLYNGLRPLYMGDAEELSVDPLFALQDWKKEVQTATQLIEITQSDMSNEMNVLELEWNKTEVFRNNYFHQMNYRSFVEMIKI